MRFISFLLERAGPRRAGQLPLEVFPGEPISFTARFWDAGRDAHFLELISERPDGRLVVIGSFSQACPRGEGLFVMQGELLPLGQGGWHQIELRLDGKRLGTRPMFVVGPGAVSAPWGRRRA